MPLTVIAPEEDSANPKDQIHISTAAPSSHDDEAIPTSSSTKHHSRSAAHHYRVPSSSPLPSPSSISRYGMNKSSVGQFTRPMHTCKRRWNPRASSHVSLRIRTSLHGHSQRDDIITAPSTLMPDREAAEVSIEQSKQTQMWDQCRLQKQDQAQLQHEFQKRDQVQIQHEARNKVQVRHEIQNHVVMQYDVEDQLQEQNQKRKLKKMTKQNQKHPDASKVVSARMLAASLWECSVFSPQSFSHMAHKSTGEHDGQNQTNGVKPLSSSKPNTTDSHLLEFSEQHLASNTHLVTTLQSELYQARAQLQMLSMNEKEHRKAVERLTRKLLKQRACQRQEEEESMRTAVRSIKLDVNEEKKSKQKHELECRNKQVEKELWECKRRLSRALEELAKEIETRRHLEDVCDDLAREISDDKKRLQQMMRRAMKIKEEVEEERQMLQLADIWREERVQMKLMDAKLEMEAKTSALDKLKCDVETFFSKAKGGGILKHEEGKSSGFMPISGDGLPSLHTVSGLQDLALFRSFPGHCHLGVDFRRVNCAQRSIGWVCHDQLKTENNLRAYVFADSELDLNKARDVVDEDDNDDLHSLELNEDPYPRWTHIPLYKWKNEYRGENFINQRASPLNGCVKLKESKVEKETGISRLFTLD